MLKVGLTGGIGSGKTSVSTLFTSLGVPVIDTDVIAHDIVNNNPSVLKKIVDVFGQKILSENGSLDRKKLAAHIFNKKENKQQLEAILHPVIRDEVTRQIQSYSQSNTQLEYVIIVIPLLLETDFHQLIDRILIVISDETIRINRVKQRDNRTLDDIRSIIANQVNDEERLSKADDIIENNSDFNELKTQVQQLHKKYCHLSGLSK